MVMNTEKSYSSLTIRVGELRRKQKSFSVQFDIPMELRHYFNTDTIYYEYDEDITCEPDGLLYAPAISGLIPLSYALGFSIEVVELDKDFLGCQKTLEKMYRKHFPEFKFGGKLIVHKTSISKASGKAPIILFSSGVDSMYTVMEKIKQNPQLYTVWGADIPVYDAPFWNLVKNHVKNFGRHFGLQNKFAKSNMTELLKEIILVNQFKLKDWWGEVSHGLLLTTMVAPIAHRNGRTMYVASTHSPGYVGRWGSMPDFDENIRFAGMRIVHKRPCTRQEKLSFLARRPDSLKFLRVCYSNYSKLNCSRCEKCYRTMVGLILAGVDPNDCNFSFENSIYKDILRQYKLGSIRFFYGLWEELPPKIPRDISSSPYYDKEFYTWLATNDFRKSIVNKKLKRRGEILSFFRSATAGRLFSKAVFEARHRLWRLGFSFAR